MQAFVTFFFEQIGKGFSYIANFKFLDFKLIDIAIFVTLISLVIHILTNKEN